MDHSQFESLYKMIMAVILSLFLLFICILGYKYYKSSSVEEKLDLINKEQINVTITSNSKDINVNTTCVPGANGTIIAIPSSSYEYRSEICYENMTRNYSDQATYSKLLDKTNISGYKYTVQFNGKLITFISLNEELKQDDYLEISKR